MQKLIGCLALLCTVTASAVAAYGGTISIGPNVFVPYGNQDGSGTRANFDYSAGGPQTLAAGNYEISQFSFQASQAGDALPVLATVSGGAAGSGTETYTIIAVGSDDVVPTGSGFYQATETSGIFNVPLGGETVYAGFVNVNGPQPVDWQYIGGGGNIIGPGASAVDSHFNPGFDFLTGNNPVQVGDQFTESGGGGGASATTGPTGAAYEINREYQFAVAVSTVPEPSSVVLLCLGGAGLFLAARRRCRT
jgi:hypothetical protein